MQVKCAWCGCQKIGDPDDPEVSHGICLACMVKHFPKEKDDEATEEVQNDSLVPRMS